MLNKFFLHYVCNNLKHNLSTYNQYDEFWQLHILCMYAHAHCSEETSRMARML